jgi:hypothetical protein
MMSNPPGKDCLPGTALSAEEDYGIRSGSPRRRLKKGGISRVTRIEGCLSLSLIEPILELGELAAQNVGRHYSSRGVAYLLGREGFGQIIDRTEPHGLDRSLEGSKGRDHDDADPWLTTQDFRKDRQSRLSLQPKVEESYIESGALKGL